MELPGRSPHDHEREFDLINCRCFGFRQAVVYERTMGHRGSSRVDDYFEPPIGSALSSGRGVPIVPQVGRPDFGPVGDQCYASSRSGEKPRNDERSRNTGHQGPVTLGLRPVPCRVG